MKTFKKIVAFTLAAVMVAAVSVGATVAYLQDEDSDVNVMTLGNVYIEQHEYERVVENGEYKTDTINNQTSYVLTDFTQAKPIYPIVGDPSSPEGYPYAGWDSIPVRMSQVNSYGGMDVFAGKNAVDKFVTVENTGKSDAYVRTLVAIEIGSTDGSLIGTSYHGTWTKNDIGTIAIDGKYYSVIEYLYKGASDVNRHVNGVLPAGDTTYPNLSQVYLASEATNEDMTAIDGNGNGTLDILVLSQAVQTAGFDNAATALETAFPKGGNNVNVAEWFKGVIDEHAYDEEIPDEMPIITIDNLEEFKQFDVAVDNNGEFKGVKVANNTNVYVKLNTDIDLSEYVGFTGIGNGNGNGFDGVFNGCGHTIKNWTVDANWNYYCALFRTTANIDVKHLTIENFNLGTGTGKGTNYGAVIGAVGGTDVLVEDVTVKNCVIKAQRTVGAVVGGITNGALTIRDCTVENVELHNAGNDVSANRVAGVYLGNGWSHHDAEKDGVYLSNNTSSNVKWIAGGVEQTTVPEYTYVK
ncbi:MAG: hypothetical protein IKM61_03475 [Eubacteriaceae bacterium]|nr:hypothetical protein [Eubacteriaceae bacterium]